MQGSLCQMWGGSKGIPHKRAPYQQTSREPSGSFRKAPGNHYIWTPEICRTIAFIASIMGLGLLFYIFVGFRYLCVYFDLGHLKEFMI